MYKNW